MGTNSARPDDLEAFAAGSREADSELERSQTMLRLAIAEFLNGSDGSFDADRLMDAFGIYTRANDEDARWTAQIAATFRAAGSDGLLALPDGAIEASLRAAGLDRDRAALDVVDPVGLGVPRTSGYANDPVNTALGNFVEVETDLIFSGLLERLTFARTYNSRADRDGPFGPRWSSWATTRLVARPSGAEFEGPDGQQVTFPRSGDGYGRVVGVNALIVTTPSGLEMDWFGGERWSFDAAGRLSEVSHGPGTRVRFAHDGDGRLVELTHERGRRLQLRWSGSRIAGLISSDGRTATYRYDDHGNLAEAEGVAGLRCYAMDAAGLIESITDADGVVELVNTYDQHGRVLTQLSPFGRRTTFSYLPGHVTVTSDDSGGPTNTFIHDRAGRLLGVVDGHERTFRKTYDDWGNPVAIIRRNGAVTVQEWDERARVVSRTDPGGATFRYTYDEADRLVTVLASTGAETRYRYHGAERTPSEIVDPEGGTSRLTVVDGLMTGFTDADGVVTRFRYDDDGNLVAAVHADGATAIVERDAAGNATAVTSPAGRRTTLGYDHRGLLVERTGPDSATWSYEYTAVGRPAAVIDPTGARSEVRYGDHGHAAEIVDPLGSVTARRYDPFGNVSGLTAPDGAKWEYVHDALSRLSALTDPAGATWLREYDVEGNLTCSIDPTGIRYTATVDIAGRVTGLSDGLTSSTFEFDELGRTLAHVRPDGTALRATYDRCGRRLTETAPDGGVTRFEFSPAGRIQRVVTPTGREEAYTYDSCGRLSSRTNGAGGRWELRYDADGLLTSRLAPTGEVENYEYDVARRLIRQSAPGAGTTRFEHDAVGRVVAVTDRHAGHRRFTYDVVGRLVRATDANGGVTAYGYNDRGWLVRITDPLGALTTRSYDEVGRLISETDPLHRTSTFAYDAAGHLIERVDATGSRVRWSYDMSGRVRAVHGGADDMSISIDRDMLGRPVTLTEPGRRTQELAWDRAGRLIERRRGELAMRWAYDADGLRSEIGYPDGSTTGYVRDGTGRTVAIEHPLLGRVRMDRDGVGRLIGVHGAGMDTTWRYEPGELVGHEIHHGSTQRTTRLARGRDGRVTEVETDGRRRQFGYDAAGQLIAETGSDGDRAFVYDAGGRLVRESGLREREYTYDATGQLLTAGAQQYGYDEAGRRVRETGPDRERTYRWDWLGRLAGTTTTAEGTTRSADIVVDALGELAEVDGTPLMWDTADPTTPLTWMGQSAVISDGHPLAVVDAAARAAGEDPWLAPDWQATVGDTASDPRGSSVDGLQLGYRGELSVEGLVWLRHRSYDPDTRAFLTPDPLPAVPGTPYSANPYHYAGNDPVNQVDPLGLRPMSDADLQAFIDQSGKGAWHSASSFIARNASDAGHLVFDVLGLVPVVGEVFDGINAIWYYAEGDHINAALSAAGMIPFAGWAATGGKIGSKLVKSGRTGSEITESVVPKLSADAPNAARSHEELLKEARTRAPNGPLGGGASTPPGEPIHFGPHSDGPGPLPDVKPDGTPGPASTFRGGSYTQRVLDQDAVMYRIWGGPARVDGPYWSLSPPEGMLQAQMEMAIQPAWNDFNHVASARIPAGTTIFEGIAAPQFQRNGAELLGGGHQIYIKPEDLRPDWVL